jgi:hypothetical protein
MLNPSVVGIKDVGEKKEEKEAVRRRRIDQ